MLLLFFCLFLTSKPVFADVDGQIDRIDNSSTTDDEVKSDKEDEDTVKESSVTNDPDTIYERYKDNSFDLMTKEASNLTPFKKSAGKVTGILKNISWAGSRSLGKFNTEMVRMMFDMDITKPIKAPILKLTASLASNMLSIAGTIGIAFISLVMVIKFMGEQRFRRAIGLFCMTILVFTGLVTLRDSNSSNSLFNIAFGVDKAVETAIVNVNPVLNASDSPTSDSVDENLKSAGDMIAAKVFYTNVYEPYLLLNYGSTNADKIRESKVEYKSKEYDRINLLLDNDVGTDLGDKIQEKTIDYENKELENKTISYTQNLDNTTFAMFYLVVNAVQTVAFFVICFVRIVIAVMQLFLIPILPVLLLLALFMTNINPFKNFGKAFGMTIFLKAMAGFACILFASFLSIGFQLASDMSNVWAKLITIIIYLLAPFGIYYFRTFLGSLFTGQMTLQNAIGFATHPFSTQKMMRDNAKARKKENKQNARDEKARRKEQLEAERKKALDRGKQELGMKQPKNAKNEAQSKLRREMQEKPKHSKPSKREQLQQNLESMHNQGRANEAKETADLNHRRTRKSLDRDAQRTAAAVALANRNLQNQGKGTMTAPKSEVKDAQSRSGRSTKRGTASSQSPSTATQQRRQGQRDLQRSKPQTVNAHVGAGKGQQGRSTTRQMANNSVGSRPRSGEKVPMESVNRQTMTTKTPRSGSGVVKRRAPRVQQKMDAINKVTKGQVKPNTTAQKAVEEYVSPQKNITRTLKKKQPINRSSRLKGQKIRRKR